MPLTESSVQPPTPTPVLIAEVGCNHKGSLETALSFIDVAANFCHVSHIKFQKRDPRSLLSPAQYDAPHPVPENSYGPTYGAHREALELTADDHRILADACTEAGLVYSCSVWDLPSLRAITPLRPTYLKIPSACNTHIELIDAMATEFEGDIHVSLGMTTRAEEEALAERLRHHGRLGDTVIYACTSGYPVAAEESYLLEINRLCETYGSETMAIGYSGHHLGIALDIAAYTLGATYIERHFTLDRTWKGTDHAASLEPDGLRRLRRDLDAVALALQARPTEIVDIEIPQREKLKWGAGAS